MKNVKNTICVLLISLIIQNTVFSQQSTFRSGKLITNIALDKFHVLLPAVKKMNNQVESQGYKGLVGSKNIYASDYKLIKGKELIGTGKFFAKRYIKAGQPDIWVVDLLVSKHGKNWAMVVAIKPGKGNQVIPVFLTCDPGGCDHGCSERDCGCYYSWEADGMTCEDPGPGIVTCNNEENTCDESPCGTSIVVNGLVCLFHAATGAPHLCIGSILSAIGDCL